jgi:hypothetical protein
MSESSTPNRRATDFDPDVDRYPELNKVLQAIMRSSEIPKGPVERVEVTTLASGEATCRVWPARADEAIGLYLPSV